MGEEYLIDTNIITKFLRGLLSESLMTLMKRIIEVDVNLSVITQIELGVYRLADELEQKSIDLFMTYSTVLPILDQAVRQTIRIRRQYKTKLPDAIIASTAMVNNYTLLSTNDIDFDRITGLAYKSLSL